jgi:hypothetical protein
VVTPAIVAIAVIAPAIVAPAIVAATVIAPAIVTPAVSPGPIAIPIAFRPSHDHPRSVFFRTNGGTRFRACVVAFATLATAAPTTTPTSALVLATGFLSADAGKDRIVVAFLFRKHVCTG